MIGIIGAGGHAKVIADIISCGQGEEPMAYFSAGLPPAWANRAAHYRDNEEQLLALRASVKGWHVAIGNPAVRKHKLEWLIAYGFPVIQAVHERSVRAESSVLGEGASVMAGAVINPYAAVGRGCIVNTASSVDHDCRIGPYVNIGPGCRLSGGVKVGELSELGAGVIVIPGVTIGKRCVIGAGAVVIDNIPDHSVAVGVPARIIKRSSN
ncbi:acetyltransferase [Paenibacillus tyrfis]|uniref:acetyltransferase n=1 Tax=Paenibacillus tyrfis TaxID=1501230 RepID=UPI0020A08DE4|nr:acetyltransferase [Paenibacillus tyrfis]MCP1306858.1 acetyltransferase [Paenibacillus tyrfis]